MAHTRATKSTKGPKATKASKPAPATPPAKATPPRAKAATKATKPSAGASKATKPATKATKPAAKPTKAAKATKAAKPGAKASKVAAPPSTARRATAVAERVIPLSPFRARPLPFAERKELGRAHREQVPLESHAFVGTPPSRDPVGILRAQDTARLQELVPIRYGRMSAAAFPFYRGAAAVMAADLAASASTDLRVQLCGDAHLSNFGVFAAPDRRLVFDLNDFDETLPGPFEWDVKRLIASLVVAGRSVGMGTGDCALLATAGAAAYRGSIALAAEQDPLAVWYHRVEFDHLAEAVELHGDKADRKRLRKASAKAARKNSLGALDKLTELVDGRRVIVEHPPLITKFHDADIAIEMELVTHFLDGYRASLPEDRRTLLDRYVVVDIARKVVGVGSVGTRCVIALLESGDGHPLFLQIKQAAQSVLEPYLGASTFDNAGRRVVEGQRVVQSASDAFLGWSSADLPVGKVDYYVRQLWDGKSSAVIEDMSPQLLTQYASVCGATLARAHARSGDAATISGYLGDDDTFERALAAFGAAYAVRNDADHAELVRHIDAGEIEVIRDI